MAYDKTKGAITTDGGRQEFDKDIMAFMRHTHDQVTADLVEQAKRKKRRGRRVVLAASAAWGLLVVVYVIIARPYGSMSEDEALHMLLTILLPPVTGVVIYNLYRWQAK